ncbi:MAG: DinB/UmuC family translesion DNA polymerase, partial [Candidatus Helarchaeota archaeon]
NIREFLKDMDITRIPGIGKKTKKYYHEKGLKTIGDLMDMPLHKMIELFGKHGKHVWEIANGLDNRPVREFNGERKSISKERTFHDDMSDFPTIFSKLNEINEKIHEILEKRRILYKTITLKIRFDDFTTYTRSKSLQIHVRNKERAIKIILSLYEEFSQSKKKVRLVGIKFSNLKKIRAAVQTNLMKFIITK